MVNYGFSQTYESFENACLLLTADYDRAKEAVDMAVKKLKKSASQLYADKTEADFLWKDREASNPWALLVEMLTEDDDEVIARRNYYLKRITELASLESLANATVFEERNKVAFRLSPLQLEMDFITNDDVLPEILSIHTNKTDLY